MANVTKHAPGSVMWVDLMTTDVEAARKFYGEVLGWSCVIGPPETGHYTICKLGEDSVAELILGAVVVQERRPPHPHRLRHRLHAHPLEPARGEQPGRLGEDALLGIVGVAHLPTVQ